MGLLGGGALSIVIMRIAVLVKSGGDEDEVGAAPTSSSPPPDPTKTDRGGPGGRKAPFGSGLLFSIVLHRWAWTEERVTLEGPRVGDVVCGGGGLDVLVIGGRADVLIPAQKVDEFSCLTCLSPAFYVNVIVAEQVMLSRQKVVVPELDRMRAEDSN